MPISAVVENSRTLASFLRLTSIGCGCVCLRTLPCFSSRVCGVFAPTPLQDFWARPFLLAPPCLLPTPSTSLQSPLLFGSLLLEAVFAAFRCCSLRLAALVRPRFAEARVLGLLFASWPIPRWFLVQFLGCPSFAVVAHCLDLHSASVIDSPHRPRLQVLFV